MSKVLAKSAAIIFVVTLLGRLLGLIRDSFVASTYGLSFEADVYNWIVGIILSLFMVIPGSINAVYIPVMTKFLGENKTARRNQLFRGLFTFIIFMFIVASVVLYIFTPQVLAVLQPGYDAKSMELGIQLFRFAIPAMFAMGIIGLLMSVSYSHKEFFVPSIGTVIFSVSAIVTILFFVPTYGIQGLMVGTVLGYLIFAVLLILDTKRKKYSFNLRFDLAKDHDLRKMGELFVPILIGNAISQSYFYVNQALASTLDAGAQSALIFANKLFLLPSAIFVGAFTIPLFPILSELIKKNEIDETKRIIRKGTSYLHILLLPTTVAFIVIGEEFVRLIFERGMFTAEDTYQTYLALLFFSFALFPLAARDLITRAYYALEDTKTPMVIGFISVVVNFIFAYLLMGTLGHSAMAIGFSIASIFQIIVMVIFLRKRIGVIFTKSYYQSFFKATVASVLMGVIIVLMKHFFGSTLTIYVSTLLYIIVGAGAYYVILVLVRETLVAEVKAMILKKIKK